MKKSIFIFGIAHRDVNDPVEKCHVLSDQRLALVTVQARRPQSITSTGWFVFLNMAIEAMPERESFPRANVPDFRSRS